jgi:hypothetical protein
MSRKKKYKVIKLPSNFEEMEQYIEENRFMLMNHVIDSIEYAHDNNIEYINVFDFKYSDFSITLSKETFIENIENIYDFYLENEKYELCTDIVNLKNKLLNYDNEEKNGKKTRSKSKSSSIFKDKKPSDN